MWHRPVSRSSRLAVGPWWTAPKFSRPKTWDCSGLFWFGWKLLCNRAPSFHGNELSQLLERVDRALLISHPIIYLFDDFSYNREAVLPSAFHTEDYMFMRCLPVSSGGSP